MNSSEYVKAVWKRVILASVILVFFTGLFAGFGPIKPVLIAMKVYGKACALHSNSTTPSNSSEPVACSEQILALNRMFTTSIAGVNAGAFLIGALSDKLGRRRMAILSLSTVTVGTLGFCFNIYWDKYIPLSVSYWMLPFVYLLMSCGGAGAFFAAMGYMFDIMKVKEKSYQSGIINALLTSCWDLSSSIFWIFNLFYFKLGTPVVITMPIYMGIVAIPAIIWIIFIDTPELNQSDDGDEDDTKKETIQQEPFNPFAAFLKEFKKKKTLILLTWLVFGTNVLSQYWYMGTILEQLYWITGSEEKALALNYAFSIILPVVGFGSNLINGVLVGGCGGQNKKDDEKSGLVTNKKKVYRTSWRAWFIVAILAAICGVFSVIRVEGLQYATFILYTFMRMLMFITLYQFVGEHFPPEIFGTVSSSTLTVGGICTFLTYALDPIVVYNLNGSYMLFNLLLAGLGTISAALLGFFAYKAKDDN